MDYEKYSRGFSPAPSYVKNCVKAFLTGGVICETGYLLQAAFMAAGMDKETAGTWSTVALVCIAQLLTGFGWYKVLGKIGGAGAAVPITGFANAVVSPAMEYKSEGIVMGVGAKIFSLTGPVLVTGIGLSVAAGIIYMIISAV